MSSVGHEVVAWQVEGLSLKQDTFVHRLRSSPAILRNVRLGNASAHVGPFVWS